MLCRISGLQMCKLEKCRALGAAALKCTQIPDWRQGIGEDIGAASGLAGKSTPRRSGVTRCQSMRVPS